MIFLVGQVYRLHLLVSIIIYNIWFPLTVRKTDLKARFMCSIVGLLINWFGSFKSSFMYAWHANNFYHFLPPLLDLY